MVISKKYDFFDDNDKDDFDDFPDTKKETDNDDDDDDDDKSSDSKQTLLWPAPDGENVTKITPTNKEYKEPKLETAEKIEKKTKADGKNLLDVELEINKIDIEATKGKEINKIDLIDEVKKQIPVSKDTEDIFIDEND